MICHHNRNIEILKYLIIQDVEIWVNRYRNMTYLENETDILWCCKKVLNGLMTLLFTEDHNQYLEFIVCMENIKI